MTLGLLDIGAIEETVELSIAAEQLGYARYWIAEHQPQPSPILIAALVAGQTERIRVGTAGVLLHYYPPLRTAHDFHLLERAFAGRIDAGFCGGKTPSPAVVDEDRDGRDYAAIMAQYPERVERVVRHLRNLPGSAAFDPSIAWGGVPEAPPQIWSLGGSDRSAALAGRLGLAFGYALMFSNSVDDPAATRVYREKFVPHPDRPTPLSAVSVGVICAATDAEAQAQAQDMKNRYFAARIVGDPATCVAELLALRERYGVDEVVACDLMRGLDARRRGHVLLASAWHERAGAPAAPG